MQENEDVAVFRWPSPERFAMLPVKSFGERNKNFILIDELDYFWSMWKLFLHDYSKYSKLSFSKFINTLWDRARAWVNFECRTLFK